MVNNQVKTELKIKDIDLSLKNKFKELTHKKNSSMKETIENFMKFCILNDEIKIDEIFKLNKKG